MVRSAGIVVVRKTKSGWKYLFLRAFSYWDFPKGRVEDGEQTLDAAFRETEEETDLVDLDLRWGEIYIDTEPYGKKKKVARYYIAETVDKVVTMGINDEIGKPEHDEYRWVKYKELKELAGPRIRKVAKWAKKVIQD